MRARFALVSSFTLLAGLLPLAAPSTAQVTDPTVGAARETEPVVLTGGSFAEWAAPGDVALEGPTVQGAQCQGGDDSACSHNQYEDPDFSSQDHLGASGVAVERLLGYHWTGDRFEQIPLQVDEIFVHYISNNASGFSFYSETDQHVTYAFEREGFRWTDSDPSDPCLAAPASEAATDPVPGLDTDDEVVFMARDGADRAPSEAPLPDGVADSFEVAVTDPSTGATSYVYVMKAAEGGAEPAFDETNGYVEYQRDADADVFLFSESSFENYGRAPEGAYFDPETQTCITEDDPATEEVEFPRQRRPGDQATITTPRYRFRYDGRWLMTKLEVSANDDGIYGPDLVDQWKARAFQQRPAGQTPCCGFEEEVNNWGGSSQLLGELSGPVRTIRETWGADSGTNVVRREVFYRDEIRMESFLRVHPIPPLDGIYAQWDYNAGNVSTYYNPYNEDGVPIDGRNDELFGNSRLHVGPDGATYDGDDDASDKLDEMTGTEEQGTGQTNEPTCRPVGPHSAVYDLLPKQLRDEIEDACTYNDIDSPDPTFSGVNAGLNWEQIAGPHGTLVLRSTIKQFTPGAAQSLVAVPYYRDDSCFDDGTGSNPGPHMDQRDVDGDEPSDSTYTDESGTTQERECWDSEVHEAPGAPDFSDQRFYQGSVGTHGVHLLLIAESDNAHTTLPLTEIDTEQRIVVLQPTLENVGERYGRHAERPLVAVALPESRRPGEARTQATKVSFTDDSARSAQFSDDATIAARLVDEDGEPIEGAEIAFELIGEQGSRTFTASTGSDGAASETITVTERPASYRLIVSYAGEPGSYEPSEDEMPFVVDKEDTAISLSDRGRGAGRELVATLADADSGEGVAGRTIEFFADGVAIGEGVTDETGTARFDPPPRYQGGPHDYEASFDGDDFYGSSASTSTSPG